MKATRDNYPITSIRYYRDYERIPCRFARVIASRRESSWRSSTRCSSPRALPVASRLRPVYPPKFRRSRRRRGTAARTAIMSYREIFPQPLFSSSTLMSRHRLRTLGTLVSIPAFPEHTITGPPCSGVLANKVSLLSFSFFLSPSPSLAPFFPFSFSSNADGHRGSL